MPGSCGSCDNRPPVRRATRGAGRQVRHDPLGLGRPERHHRRAGRHRLAGAHALHVHDLELRWRLRRLERPAPRGAHAGSLARGPGRLLAPGHLRPLLGLRPLLPPLLRARGTDPGSVPPGAGPARRPPRPPAAALELPGPPRRAGRERDGRLRRLRPRAVRGAPVERRLGGGVLRLAPGRPGAGRLRGGHAAAGGHAALGGLGPRPRGRRHGAVRLRPLAGVVHAQRAPAPVGGAVRGPRRAPGAAGRAVERQPVRHAEERPQPAAPPGP